MNCSQTDRNATWHGVQSEPGSHSLDGVLDLKNVSPL